MRAASKPPYIDSKALFTDASPRTPNWAMFVMATAFALPVRMRGIAEAKATARSGDFSPVCSTARERKPSSVVFTPGVRTNVTRLVGNVDEANCADALAAALTGGGLSAETRKAIAAQKNLPRIAGLILGSPEFQWQ